MYLSLVSTQLGGGHVSLNSFLDPQSSAIFLLLAVFLYIGWHYRTDDSDEIHTVGRKSGYLRTTASIFTLVGAPHYLIFTALTFIFGWWPLVFYVGLALGCFTLAIWAPRIHRYGEQDAHPYADIAFIELGRTGSLLSIIGGLFAIGLVVAQIIATGRAVTAISPISYDIAVISISITIFGYLYWGGYRSLLMTNVVQGFLMLFFTIALSFLVVNLGTIPNPPINAAGASTTKSFEPSFLMPLSVWPEKS